MKKFALTLCQLLVVMLMVDMADARSLRHLFQNLPTETRLQDTEDEFSFQASEEDHGAPSSDQPQELPAGESGADEENKEKDGSEDDWTSDVTHSQAFAVALSHSISSYYLSVSNRLDAVPFYVLFHCWKSSLV